ncbi:kinase-like protein [Cystobasidium minutum MCA 4210]|uniref:kinase-like protein n=1 Tax=Cystobasidium minutum MCA 4210 TaxID=1397322 RepID=UPI0034CE764C|eukprot:jgi/Rhomi1/28051/CE28050_67
MYANYQKISTLGEGAFGTVHLVQHRESNKMSAMKVSKFKVTGKYQQMIRNELDIMAKLKHDNIARLEETYIYENRLCIVMEYCEGGDLRELISKHVASDAKVPTAKSWSILAQLVAALHYCHHGPAPVLHRDIKPENVLITASGMIKLADFGLAKALVDERKTAESTVGTLPYMAPELLGRGTYNHKADIWSLGCLMFELVNLRLPFSSSNAHALTRQIRQKDFGSFGKDVPAELERCITQMLDTKMKTRLSTIELLANPVIMSSLQAVIFFSKEEKLKRWYDKLITFDMNLATRQMLYERQGLVE